MTKRGVIEQIFHETTGQSRERVRQFFDVIVKMSGPGSWNDELSAADAEKWLAELRAEKRPILAWLNQGHHTAKRR